MKKLGKFLLAFITGLSSMAILASCMSIESGSINDFVGEYVSGPGYERVKHYYWDNTTIKSENEFLSSGCTFLIYPNKKVLFQYPNYGDTKEGRVRVFGDHVCFYDLPINSSYEFKLNDDHSLSYSYSEDKFGLEYDFTTRSCYLQYRGQIDENKSIVTEDKGFIHIQRAEETYATPDENYVFRGFSGHFTITGEDAYGNPIDADSIPISWSSNDLSVAKVDYKGAVEVISSGSFMLKAQYGNYVDEIEVNTAILSSKLETTELADEYRGGNTYDLPFSFLPYNASIEFKTSDSSIIELNGDNKTFKVLKGGEATITAEAFAFSTRERIVETVTIAAIDELAPRFEHDNRTMTGATISVAKNQFSRIEPEKLDIHAYSSTGVDITEEITIESGDYSLFKEGTYNVVLAVTDVFNRTSRFNLTLVVTEYETRKYDSINVSDGIEEVSRSVTPVKIVYSFAIKEIDFAMTIKLKDYYDTADLDITWLIYFKIKRWDDSRYIDHSGNAIVVKDYHFVKDGATTLKMTYHFSYSGSLDPNTLTEVGFYVLGKGYYYKYVSY